MSDIKVLVVNKDKRLMNNISNYLASDGMLVYKIGHSNKLEEKIEKLSPTILLLDCNICPVNAFEICREYKHKLPIILTKLGKYTSNQTLIQEKRWATMQGARALLYLPCGGEYLITLVKEAISEYKR